MGDFLSCPWSLAGVPAAVYSANARLLPWAKSGQTDRLTLYLGRQTDKSFEKSRQVLRRKTRENLIPFPRGAGNQREKE